MKNYPKHIKSTLNSVIRSMTKHREDFCRCPGKDFTRKRKLPFEEVLSLLVKMGGHSLRDEMLNFLNFKETPASVSALVQQRSKILPEALEYLFQEFTNRCQKPKQAFDDLYQSMTGKTLKEKDEIIDTVCHLCRLHQQSGFTDGIQLGLRLAQELKTP